MELFGQKQKEETINAKEEKSPQSEPEDDNCAKQIQASLQHHPHPENLRCNISFEHEIRSVGHHQILWGSCRVYGYGDKDDLMTLSISLQTGTPYISTVHGYGAFAPQESIKIISYSELNRLIEDSNRIKEKYAGINEENWRSYIPEEDLKSAKSRSGLPNPIILDETLQDVDPAESPVLEIFLLMQQLYGGSAVYFRRVGSDYRAFYATTSVNRSYIVMDESELSEAYIDAVMEGKHIGPTDKYDRLLTSKESAYVLNQLNRCFRTDDERWESASTVIEAKGFIKTKSGIEELSEATNRFYRIMSSIKAMAERGGV